MKNCIFVFLGLVLSACGQPGPLYLPTETPPVYVGPDAAPEQKETGDQELKAEPSAQPTKNQPEK